MAENLEPTQIIPTETPQEVVPSKSSADATQPLPSVQTQAPTPEPVATVRPASEFKGRTIQLIGWRLLGGLLTMITLGIFGPWAYCMVLRWETKHTYVNGKRLCFDGKGHQLLGRSLLWGLLTVVTCGIYGLFVPVRWRKWRACHTRFAKTEADTVGPSGCKIAIMVIAGVLAVALLITAVVFLAPKMSFFNDGIGGFFSDLFDKADDLISFRPSDEEETPGNQTEPPVAGPTIVGTWNKLKNLDFLDDTFYAESYWTFYADGTCEQGIGNYWWRYHRPTGSIQVDSEFNLPPSRRGTYTYEDNVLTITITYDEDTSVQLPYTSVYENVRIQGDTLDFDHTRWERGTPEQLGEKLYGPATGPCDASIWGEWNHFQPTDDPNTLVNDCSYLFNNDGTYTFYTQNHRIHYNEQAGNVSSGGGYGRNSDDGVYSFDGTTLTLNFEQTPSIQLVGDVLYIDGEAYYRGDINEVTLPFFIGS